MARLSDTKAVVGAFGGDRGPRNTYSSKSTRRISNGFITSECNETGGVMVSKETFHSTPEPTGAAHGPAEDRNSLRDAARYLKGERQ